MGGPCAYHDRLERRRNRRAPRSARQAPRVSAFERQAGRATQETISSQNSRRREPGDPPMGVGRDPGGSADGTAARRGGDRDAQSLRRRGGSPAANKEREMTIEKKPVYRAADLNGFDPERQLGRPGEYPFTRGIHPTMYRGKLWTMRQFAGFGGAADTNRRYKFLLEHGQTGLSVAFDFPTLMGYDSDHARSEGEVGKCGVAISSLADMETLFDGIPLDQVSTSMTINGPAVILYAFYVAAAEKQGVSS